MWVKRNGEECILPGLTNFTANQLFWISNAHRWCASYSDYSLRYYLMKDTHTPGPFRTNGTFMLSDEFANDFNCQKGTPMNPITKCGVGSIWPENQISELFQYNAAGKCRCLILIIVTSK